MKAKRLRLLLVLTGLLAAECSLDAYPPRLSESGAIYPHVPNALSLEKNTQAEKYFFDTDCDTADTQKKDVADAYKKILENKLKVEDKQIKELKKRLTNTDKDVAQIKKEHAELKSVERINQ